MKLKSVIGSVLLLLAGAVAASPAYPPVQTDAGEAPAALLKNGVQALLAFMRQQPRPDAIRVQAFLDNRVAPYFDFDHMAREVIGRMGRRMTPQQRAAVTVDLKQKFLTRLGMRLAGYEGQTVRFQRPVLGRDGRTARAGIVILNRGSYPARIDFRLYRSERGWLVYDVAANGQSAIVHFRRALRREYMQQQMQQRRMPAVRGAYPGAGAR